MVNIVIIIVATELVEAPAVEEVAVRVEEAPIDVDVEALLIIAALILLLVLLPLRRGGSSACGPLALLQRWLLVGGGGCVVGATSAMSTATRPGLALGCRRRRAISLGVALGGRAGHLLPR